jgi:hypothetical protein
LIGSDKSNMAFTTSASLGDQVYKGNFENKWFTYIYLQEKPHWDHLAAQELIFHIFLFDQGNTDQMQTSHISVQIIAFAFTMVRYFYIFWLF